MPVDLSSRRAAFDVYHAYVGDSDEDTGQFGLIFDYKSISFLWLS